MNYMIGVNLIMSDFPKFEFPKIDIPKFDFGSIVPSMSNIPNVGDIKFKNITSAIDNLQKNSLYDQIDELAYSIKLKKMEINNYKVHLAGIKKSKAIKYGLIVSIIVSVASVVIPFLIIAFNNLLEKYKIFIFFYTVVSFCLSMVLLFGYLIYSYKK